VREDYKNVLNLTAVAYVSDHGKSTALFFSPAALTFRAPRYGASLTACVSSSTRMSRTASITESPTARKTGSACRV
jgi:hypothetical protein